MHGGDNDYWKPNFHMRTRGTGSLACDVYSNAFSKDGRKITVGDCAFFKPPQDSPPFIGIIRCLIAGKDKDSNLKFGVNWLYRTSEVDLEKGIHLEAAPNEIFYSFHEDEKRQEEGDHLISKTRREMHDTIQPSPKTMNDTAPASLAKAGSDVAQSVSSSPSHGKVKKRERSNLDSEPVKRLHKINDVESNQLKSEDIFKAEVARITDHGGLLGYESVEKLVHLMVPGKSDKKISLSGRIMLASVVAATDKFDCLSLFLQLNGLPVFDEWLQEIHKGKISDGNSYRDVDKSIEEFLLILLRALDKLPVNLQALQMCNIGKSVNHLRSHKNLEIQRKARSLVDKWKKRVEAEMNIDDGKSGSNIGIAWHGRHNAEPSQGGHRNTGNSENATKNASSQLSASKTMLNKPMQSDTQTTTSTSPGHPKAASSPVAGGVDYKDSQPKSAADALDNLPNSGKDERNSSSSQSFSQSSSSDHIKTAESSWKEDPRCSTAGSMGTGERLRRTSRPRKSVSGLPGHASRGAQRDCELNRSPLHKIIASEKSSNNEKMHDVPVADGNSHKMIIKIPNCACSPGKSANGGPVNEQRPSNIRATFPACSDKHEKLENGYASQLNDAIGVATKSDEADGTSAASHEDARSANGDHSKKVNELPIVASSVSNDSKLWKSHEPSAISMNTLVESCINQFEASALISAVDDIGINLLASVVAREISMGDSIPSNSLGNTVVAEDSIAGNSGRSSYMDNNAREQTHCADKTEQCNENKSDSISLVKDSRDGVSSIDENLGTDLSNLDLLKKQDEGQLSDSRVVSPFEVSVKLVPVIKAGMLLIKDEHSENEEREVPKAALVHSSGGSNDNFENKATEGVGSGVYMKKEFPSPTPSDAKEVNDDMKTLGPESQLDSDKVLAMDAKGLAESRDVTDSNLQIFMDQNQNKTESHNNKSRTTEINSVAGHLCSAASDFSRNSIYGKSKNKEDNGHCNGGSVQNNSPVTKTEECPPTVAPCASPTAGMEKLGFDLNEGFISDEVRHEEQKSIPGVSYPAAVHVATPIPLSAVSNSLPASVTVAAASKGAFFPPEDLLRARGELGWKGSAATSAFRPAEPRKVSESQVNMSIPPDAPGRSGRPFLNIDLNVPDDSMQDDVVSHCGMRDIPRTRSEGSPSICCFRGLDLDLNQIVDATEMGKYSAITNRKMEVPGMPFKHVTLSNGEASGRMNFDLNNGPMHEDVGAEASILSQNFWSNMPSQPPIVGLRMNNAEMGNFASWFPQGGAIPAVLPDRADQAFSIAAAGTPQRIYYTPPGSTPFAPDIYRGPVLSSSSSPALSFPSAPYQYPMFPFGTSFPVPSATLPGSATYMDSLPGGRHNLTNGHSQFLGNPGIVSSSYPDGRPNGGLENSSRWGGNVLDLNTGPGSIDIDSRNDPLPFALTKFSVASSQTVTEEQMRMFQASGAVLNRKEPDSAWDAEKPKQPSWL